MDRLGRARPARHGTRSLRRTEAALVRRPTGDLRAARLLPGHANVGSTARNFGVEVDDALAASEQVGV